VTRSITAVCPECEGSGKIPTTRRTCPECELGFVSGPPSPLRWHKDGSGQYRAISAAMVGDRTAPVRVVVRHVPEWPAGMRWGVEVFWVTGDPATPEHQLCRIDDAPAATRGDANKGAEAMLRVGWQYLPALGWCLRDTEPVEEIPMPSPVTSDLMSASPRTVAHLGVERVDEAVQIALLAGLDGAVKAALRTPPRVDQARVPTVYSVLDADPEGFSSVKSEDSIWSGKSGRWGDGEMVASLQTVHRFPSTVKLAWLVSWPLPDHEVSAPRYLSLTGIVDVEVHSEASGSEQAEWYPSEYLVLSGDAVGSPTLKATKTGFWLIQQYKVSGRMKENA